MCLIKNINQDITGSSCKKTKKLQLSIYSNLSRNPEDSDLHSKYFFVVLERYALCMLLSQVPSSRGPMLKSYKQTGYYDEIISSPDS